MISSLGLESGEVLDKSNDCCGNSTLLTEVETDLVLVEGSASLPNTRTPDELIAGLSHGSLATGIHSSSMLTSSTDCLLELYWASLTTWFNFSLIGFQYKFLQCSIFLKLDWFPIKFVQCTVTEGLTLMISKVLYFLFNPITTTVT